MDPWRWRSRRGGRRGIPVGLLLFASLAPAVVRAELPSFTKFCASYRSSEGRLLDRHGTLLQERRLNSSGRALDWVRLGDVSPELKRAVLAVEDRRFFTHGGVDYQAAFAAAWSNLVSGGHRGASTLTMQLVGYLEPELRRKKRGWWDKLRQANLAWEIEKRWSKEEIFEAYLNLVSFRGEYQGVGTASRALFDKEPHALNLREAFFLAALLKSPGMSAGRVGDRLCAFREEESSLGPCPELRAFAALTLEHPARVRRRVSFAPHLAARLLSPARPEVKTSLDASLQTYAEELLSEQIRALNTQNVRDGAVVVLENKTGQVLAYVGGSGAYSESPAVDMAVAHRQAGSTLKPFLYGAAFAKGTLKPNSWILDEPLRLAVSGRGDYRPENYDRSFHGPVTVAKALGSSLNVPAVRTIDLVGVDTLHDLMERFGFANLRSAEDYGASLALGTADVTLLELANAYRTLAREGLYSPVSFDPVAREVPGRRVLAAKAAREVSSVLASRDARSLTFGWESLLATPFGAAVKTGTSKDMRDNWCVGYTPAFTVAVWVGNSGGAPMWQVSGVSGAAPVWRSLMERLQQGTKARPYPALAEASPVFERAHFGRIVYPTADSILALDPDIPPGREIVEAEIDGEGRLRLDGAELSDARWAPTKGKHTLSLLSGEGKLLDEVRFEVR
jgi:penicillin-binding protein 1C